MGMQVGGKKGGPMADINVTPLVDVVLVLLIIFMVVTPMLSSGVDVFLPESKTAEEAADNGHHLVVSIKQDESVYVETTRTSKETLIEDLNAEWKKKADRALLIKGDRRLTWRQVHGVLSVVQENGLTTMLLATEGKKGAEGAAAPAAGGAP
jgi:biopolymer transport protein TolR